MPDLELSEPIARGGTAEIFACDDRHVLKLFLAGRSLGDVKYEAKVAHAVQSAGLPVPAVRALVEQAGRYGIIYERIYGVSLLRTINSRPWRLPYAARLLARLHVAIHTSRVAGLPSQRARFTRKIAAAPGLGEATRQRLLARLERMPEEDRLCHGDFHPDNVLITERGPVIIDWNDATRGTPAADVARSLYLMRGASLPPDVPMAWLLNLGRRMFCWVYRREYRRLRPRVVDEAAGWEPLVAAGRLTEGIIEEHVLLLRLAEQG